MENNQILIITVVIVVVIIILVLIGWCWFADQPSSKYPQDVSRTLFKIKQLTEDQSSFVRTYIIELATNSPGQDVTKSHLAVLYANASREFFLNRDEAAATQLSQLWVAKLALLKRLHDGEDINVINQASSALDTQIIAIMVCNVGGADKLRSILESLWTHTVQQLTDYTSGAYDRSIQDHILVKKESHDLFEWQAWLLVSRSGKSSY